MASSAKRVPLLSSGAGWGCKRGDATLQRRNAGRLRGRCGRCGCRRRHSGRYCRRCRGGRRLGRGGRCRGKGRRGRATSESAHSAGPWGNGRGRRCRRRDRGRGRGWRDCGGGRGGRRRGRRGRCGAGCTGRVRSTGRWRRDGHRRTGPGVLEGPDVRDELCQVLVLRSLVRRQCDGGLRQGLGGGVAVLLGFLENPVRSSFLRPDCWPPPRGTAAPRRHPSPAGVLGARGCVPPPLTSGAPEYNPLLTYSLTANFCREREAAPN